MNLTDLQAHHFVGFISVRQLSETRLEEIPERIGVYAVLLPDIKIPAFLTESAGGWFKGENPTVDEAVLQDNWVNETQVLYFGKAGPRKTRKQGLRVRIEELIKFGSGEPIGHKGGRLIWQLAGSQEFLVAWCETPGRDPFDVEREMMDKFRAVFGKWPFANLQGPRQS